MNFNFLRKQAVYIKITLITLLFASASLQSILSSKTADEQISDRINDALGALVEQNESTVYDWASWDDTVELAQQRYEDYFTDNFNEDTQRLLQLAVVMNATEEPVSGEIWDEDSNSFKSLEAGEMTKISTLLQECGSSFTAVLGDTYLISSSFISPTESRADAITYGCLYFGKRIPDLKLSNIFASIVNNSKLNIKNISIQSTEAMGSKLKTSKKTLTIQGSHSGLFGSVVIAEKNQTVFSFYQLLILGLYTLLIIILIRENT